MQPYLLNFIRSPIYEPQLGKIIMDYYHTEYFLFNHYTVFDDILYLAPDKQNIYNKSDDDILLDGPYNIPTNFKDLPYLYFAVRTCDYLYLEKKDWNMIGPFSTENEAIQFGIRQHTIFSLRKVRVYMI